MKAQQIFLAMIIGVLFIACKKDGDNTPIVNNPPPNPGTPEIITDILSTGIWKVSSYINNNKDETPLVANYSFNFSKSGTCNADNGAVTYSGIWHSGYDDSTVKLKLMFPIPAELAKISEDWHVIETTATKIRLHDVSGGNGGTDLLTLTKL